MKLVGGDPYDEICLGGLATLKSGLSPPCRDPLLLCRLEAKPKGLNLLTRLVKKLRGNIGLASEAWRHTCKKNSKILISFASLGHALNRKRSTLPTPPTAALRHDKFELDFHPVEKLRHTCDKCYLFMIISFFAIDF